ncbi:hypothetical protein B296_00003198 [Ensete ventricosum]|uniref:Uncharacterized protein n=1 Tax=Ensete ventricosum TaxID=4639 RepID=A0A427B8K0_ENSVE|nr:hypothetical protein B296_00003198 [Ensete ventricosum]
MMTSCNCQICIMLCADHGPCVSGAHNTIVTARAGKDLVSSLVSGDDFSNIGLLTIGPRFGGAIDDAARYFKDACDKVSCILLTSGLATNSLMLYFSYHRTEEYLQLVCSQGLTPYEFVEGMKKKGIRVPGIGHRYMLENS